MIEKILKDLYRIEIPLPESPLRAVNSYVVRNPERNLLIDTGWNHEESMNAMQSGLEELGIDIEKTDFFITHLHPDHLGLVSNLAKDTSLIYFNQPDADRFNSGFHMDDFMSFARLNGYPEKEFQEALHRHPGFKFRSKGNLVFHIMKDGDTISIGDFVFECVGTPGHSRGHMCLYEAHSKILLAGDHILSDITPNIQLWSDEWNPLKEYLASLDKVYELDIELVLPGHRNIFRNCKERIQQLRAHHRKRFDEIISILKQGKKDAFQVASEMSWDVLYDSWDLFPITQKWFAIGEAISHLKYLEEEGIILRETQKQRRVYSLDVNVLTLKNSP